MLNYISSVIRCFTTQRGDYSSRTSCKTFWGFALVLTGLYVLLYTIAYCLTRYYSAFWGSVVFFASLVLLIEFIPTTVAATVRRFHDRNISGYWAIPCFLVPVIGWTAGAIYAFFLPGQAQENNYPRQIDKVRPFWKHKRFWFLHAAAVLVVFTQFPLAPVTITERSHYIAQPRRPDGKVDYAGAVFQKIGPSFKNPEENGVRQLYQLYGAKIIYAEPQDKSWKAACEQLQLDPNLKPQYDKIPNFHEYLAENKIDVKTLKFDKAEFIRQNPQYADDESEQEENSDDEDYQKCVYVFYEESLSSGPAWTSAQHPIASQWLDDHAAELDAWSKAIRAPIFQFPFEFKSPIISQGLFYIDVTNIIRFVYSMRIRRSVGEGNIDQALEDMETLLCYAKRIEEGYNCLITGLVNQAIASTAWNSIKAALRTPGFCESMTDEQWERLNKLAAQNYLVDLKTLFNGEFVCIYDAIEHFVFDGGPQNGSFFRATLSDVFGGWSNDPESVMSGFIPQDFLLVDENIFREHLYQTRLSVEDAIFENDRVMRNQKFDKLDTFTIIDNGIQIPDELTIRGRSCLTARNVFRPAITFNNCLLSRDRVAATQKLVQVAIAIERFRVKERQYPVALETLVGKYWDEKQQGVIRFDPCSGKDTLGYRINKQSKEDWERELKQGLEKDPEYRHKFDDYSFPVWRPFILYSVGTDLKDDNGEVLSLTSDEGDVIF